MHNPTDPTPPHPTSHVICNRSTTTPKTSRQLSFIFSGEYERTPTTRSRKSTAGHPISGPRGRPKTLSGLTFGIRTKFRDLSVQRNHHTTTTLQVPEDPQEITNTPDRHKDRCCDQIPPAPAPSPCPLFYIFIKYPYCTSITVE